MSRKRLELNGLEIAVETPQKRDHRRDKNTFTRVIGYRMKLSRRIRFLGVMMGALGIGVISHPCTAQEPSAAGAESEGSLKGYLTQVKPLLRSRCYSCHGSLKRKAGLRLDTVELMLRGGDSGPAVVRGAVEESFLLDRVMSGDALDRMPPEDAGEPLTAEQVDLLRNWIAAGARRRRTRPRKQTRVSTGRFARSSDRRFRRFRRGDGGITRSTPSSPSNHRASRA